MTSIICRTQVEKVVTDALAELSGDLKGAYYALSDMAPEDEKRLIEVGIDNVVSNGIIVSENTVVIT